MKKIIISVLLAMSFSATADQIIDTTTARLRLVDAMENYLLITDNIKPQYRSFSYTVANDTVEKLVNPLLGAISKAVNEGYSCEVITASFATNNFAPMIRGKVETATPAAKENAEKLISAFTVYTLTSCVNLTK
ncbi:hypothetical protein MVUOKPPV_CDS0292 [Klebsiella phage phi1_175008]|uniref:Uncharacterized protein n=2 Tax=Klebsiella phage phi1_175008 TaxID=3127744 RepID=A0ACD5FRG6_9CAUD